MVLIGLVWFKVFNTTFNNDYRSGQFRAKNPAAYETERGLLLP